ncbi:MAG: hypothetical protein R3258_09630 [Acidimicrobiia bacterium]|nr:hypothetical protein [Acidimicrobiia bacterium]
MLWLSRPPWARWIGAGLIVVAALWFELSPAANVEHPFATVDIDPGQLINAGNTEMRHVPSGLLENVEIGQAAGRKIESGEPILASDVRPVEPDVPKGWWVVAASLPRGARTGDHVQVLMLDSGLAAPGIVIAEGSDDPFDSFSGAIAIHPDHASDVAAAAVEGRIAVLLSTG